ncbi:MAG: glutaredoxin family protein [Arenicellales bacterium]
MNNLNHLSVCKIALLLLVSFSFYPAAAGELYKWVDEKGNVTYQSSPPPENAAKVEKSKISTGVDDAVDKTETVKTADKDVKPVVFYSKQECPSCGDVREYFALNGIPYEEIDLTDNKTEEEELEKKLGYSSVPTFGVGGKYISGFEKSLLKKILISEGYTFPKEEKNE